MFRLFITKKKIYIFKGLLKKLKFKTIIFIFN